MNHSKAGGNLKLRNLNIGAGADLIVEDYLNIDYSYTPEFIERYRTSTNVGVLRMDIVNEFRGIQNVDVVYTCHLLEHVTLVEGRDFLTHCYSSLNIGGKLRLCVPDFNIWATALSNNDTEFFDFYRSNMPYKIDNVYNNNFAFFTTVIYGHGHRMIYTFDFLQDLLKDIGFRNIEQRVWGESNIPQISTLEDKNNILRSKESLIIEAIK